MIPTIDFETYSEAGYRFDATVGYFVPLQPGKPGLTGINSSVYAEHESTEVISLAYDLMDGNGVKLWAPWCPPPVKLFDHIGNGGLVEAHNSKFEHDIWNRHCVPRLGWPRLPIHQLRCSMAKARAYGLPGGLDAVAGIVGSVPKDKRGKQLIQLLSIPKKPTKADPTARRFVKDHPGLYYEMYEYNRKDISAEKGISSELPEMPDFETRVFILDQQINERGVFIDQTGLENCIRLFEQIEAERTEELIRVTGGAVNTIPEIAKLKSGDKWLQLRGFNFPSLDKNAVSDALNRSDLPQDVRRALEIRQEMGGASVKKIYALKRYLNRDGRIRNLFQYCGAERTGRWAGRGPQPQNMKNGGPEVDGEEWGNDLAEKALYDISWMAPSEISKKWGSPVDLIGSCMRSLFVAAPGCDLICSDYSAIEAVVLSAMAGEEWRLEVFRTHGKIYEMSASMISGVPFEEIVSHKQQTGKHHPLRKKIGKIAELASGYAGWVGAWKNFGADEFMTDEEIKTNILKWREKSPAIVEMWGGQWRKVPGEWSFYPELYGVEGMFISALQYPGYTFGTCGLEFSYGSRRDTLNLRLPSGRILYYHNPRLTPGTDPRGLTVLNISYHGVDSYTGKWSAISTYGGKLVENCVQAVSRDILAAAMLRLNAAGYPIVMHVHDEVVAEVPEGFGSVEDFEKIMSQKEAWFSDWPIKASGGWRGKRYRK